MTTEAKRWFDGSADTAPLIDYAERARYYEVEYRTDVDRSFLRGLLTPEVGSVLEIPCGAGRNLDWLADSGRQVVCADLEPAMVARVEERIAAARAGERISAVVADLCDFDLGRRFDLVLVPQEAFQLLAEPGQGERALRRLARHLSEGGTLLLDLHTFRADRPGGRSPLPDYFDPALPAGETVVEWTRPVDGDRWLSRARRQHDEGATVSVDYHYQLSTADRLIGSWQSHIRLRRYTLRELQALAARAGLRVSRVASDYDGTPHAPGAARLITLLQPARHREQRT
jgi:SAM-dependent methyltransferase